MKATGREYDKIKQEMIAEAKEKYLDMSICGNCKTFEDSFTIIVREGKEYIVFWFNVPLPDSKERTTKIIGRELKS
jgi:hypothetical protein